jgi:hypothetical protein
MLLAGSPASSIAEGSNTVCETLVRQRQVFSGEGEIPPPSFLQTWTVVMALGLLASLSSAREQPALKGKKEKLSHALGMDVGKQHPAAARVRRAGSEWHHRAERDARLRGGAPGDHVKTTSPWCIEISFSNSGLPSLA